MFVNIPFNEEPHILIKIWLLKGYTAQSMFKEFRGKNLEWAKSLEAAKSNLDTVQGVADHEVQRRWSCWWPHIQSGRCMHHRHFSHYLKFQGILEFLGHQLHHPWSFHSHPPRGELCAYSVANVFSGSVEMQLRWGGKLCTCLEARNIMILYANNC